MRLPALPKSNEKHHQPSQPLLKIVLNKLKKKRRFISLSQRKKG